MTGHAEGLNIFLKAIETFKMDEEDDASPIPTELSERSEAKFAVGMRIPSFFDGGFYSQPPANESCPGFLFVGESAYAPTKDIGTTAGK